MRPEYVAIILAVALVLYFGVRVVQGDRCPRCRALVGRETGEKRVKSDGTGLEWDIECGKCGHTEVNFQEGLECPRCELVTAVVESRYTGTNGLELWAIRCLNCSHAWRKEYNYSEP